MINRAKRAKRALVGTVVALLMAAGLVAIQASPAMAIGSCWTGLNVGCATTDAGSSGTVVNIGTTQGCRNVSATYNDTFSWAGNNSGSGYLLRMWQDGNCSGASFYLVPGTSRSFTGAHWAWNDEVSSHAVYPCAAVYEC
jgi:hypothetical protein